MLKTKLSISDVARNLAQSPRSIQPAKAASTITDFLDACSIASLDVVQQKRKASDGHDLRRSDLDSPYKINPVQARLWLAFDDYFNSARAERIDRSRKPSVRVTRELANEVFLLASDSPIADVRGDYGLALYNLCVQEIFYNKRGKNQAEYVLPSDGGILSNTSSASGALPVESKSPREYYGQDEVGIYLLLQKDPLAVELTPYWSVSALRTGMQHLQDLGKSLSETDQIAKSELSGSGSRELLKTSMIAVLLYEAASTFMLEQRAPYFLSGITAAAVVDSSDHHYKCQLAVVGLPLNQKLLDKKDLTLSEAMTELSGPKCHLVFNFDLLRSALGLVSIIPDPPRAVDPFRLVWYDRFPAIASD